jgi:DNA-binding NarL/FixJ family response regulator
MPPVAKAIRVAVANQPRLMRELMVMTLEDEEGVEVVAEIIDETEISRTIEGTTPEFLIVSLDSVRFGAPAREAMLRRHPDMKILALASDGNSFAVFSVLDGIRTVIHEGSEEEILRVMRGHSHVSGGG